MLHQCNHGVALASQTFLLLHSTWYHHLKTGKQPDDRLINSLEFKKMNEWLSSVFAAAKEHVVVWHRKIHPSSATGRSSITSLRISGQSICQATTPTDLSALSTPFSPQPLIAILRATYPSATLIIRGLYVSHVCACWNFAVSFFVFEGEFLFDRERGKLWWRSRKEEEEEEEDWVDEAISKSPSILRKELIYIHTYTFMVVVWVSDRCCLLFIDEVLYATDYIHWPGNDKDYTWG